MHLFKKTHSAPSINPNLLAEIEQVKRQMEDSYLHFQYAVDPDLIDCYIYEGNAAWKKYRFLLRQAKSKNGMKG